MDVYQGIKGVNKVSDVTRMTPKSTSLKMYQDTLNLAQYFCPSGERPLVFFHPLAGVAFVGGWTLKMSGCAVSEDEAPAPANSE